MSSVWEALCRDGSEALRLILGRACWRSSMEDKIYGDRNHQKKFIKGRDLRWDYHQDNGSPAGKAASHPWTSWCSRPPAFSWLWGSSCRACWGRGTSSPSPPCRWSERRHRWWRSSQISINRDPESDLWRFLSLQTTSWITAFLLLPNTQKAPASQTGPRSVGGKSQNTDARQHTSTLPISHTNRLVLQLLKLGQWLLDACSSSTVALGSTNPVTLPEMRTLFLRYANTAVETAPPPRHISDHQSNVNTTKSCFVAINIHSWLAANINKARCFRLKTAASTRAPVEASQILHNLA